MTEKNLTVNSRELQRPTTQDALVWMCPAESQQITTPATRIYLYKFSQQVNSNLGGQHLQARNKENKIDTVVTPSKNDTVIICAKLKKILKSIWALQ